jgi:tetratricopeptide (TPR) repeat protein
MKTDYVFPSRPESFDVLREALSVDPHDATAHFLLGSLYLSGGMTEAALAEWQQTRSLKPEIPTLHRDIGYTLLRSGGSPERAIEVFREGTKYDPHNAEVYRGLEEAMQSAGSPLTDRIQALESFPDLGTAAASFVFHLVQLLGDAGRFDRAEELLANRFFPREEGAVNVRQIYIELRLKGAQFFAAHHRCDQATDIVSHLSDVDPRFAFTGKGMGSFVTSKTTQEAVSQVTAACR